MFVAEVSHVYIHISTSRGLQTLNEFIETNALEGTITLLPEDLSKVSSSLIKHEVTIWNNFFMTREQGNDDIF